MRTEITRKPFPRRHGALFQGILFVLICCVVMLSLPSVGNAQVTIAQISDTHLGEPHAPHAFDNLRRTVDMVNARHPDAVIVSGDVGENYDEWLRARGILKWLHAPVYYAPGNHDVHSTNVAKYREVFGPDYYRFQVKGVTFLFSAISTILKRNLQNRCLRRRKPNRKKCFRGSRVRVPAPIQTIAATGGTGGIVARIVTTSASSNLTPTIAGMTIIEMMIAGTMTTTSLAETLLLASSTSRRNVVTICLQIPSLTGSSMSRIDRVN